MRDDVYILVFLAFANAWGLASYFVEPRARPWVLCTGWLWVAAAIVGASL